jgi:hypothetical protein
MRITADIRAAMAQKSTEFVEAGKRVYLPLSAVPS